MSMSQIFISDRVTARWSPQVFLRFLKNEKNREAIVSSRFIAPKLGSNHFGKIEVELKHEPKGKTPKLELEQSF